MSDFVAGLLSAVALLGVGVFLAAIARGAPPAPWLPPPRARRARPEWHVVYRPRDGGGQ